MQAAADARGAADVQVAWLRANMGAYFSRKLLSVVRRIERHVGAHDDGPGHQFPRLAGSYLSEVSLQPLFRSCRRAIDVSRALCPWMMPLSLVRCDERHVSAPCVLTMSCWLSPTPIQMPVMPFCLTLAQGQLQTACLHLPSYRGWCNWRSSISAHVCMMLSPDAQVMVSVAGALDMRGLRQGHERVYLRSWAVNDE